MTAGFFFYLFMYLFGVTLSMQQRELSKILCCLMFLDLFTSPSPLLSIFPNSSNFLEFNMVVTQPETWFPTPEGKTRSEGCSEGQKCWDLPK